MCLDLSSCFFCLAQRLFCVFVGVCVCVRVFFEIKGAVVFFVKERERASNDLELTPRSFDHIFSNHVFQALDFHPLHKKDSKILVKL